VWCWGGNSRGQLGIDKYEIYQTSYPQQVQFTKPVLKVVAGYDNFCAIHADSTMSCWGSNPFNIFNTTPAYNDQMKPTFYPDLTDVKDVNIGIFNICVIKNDNSLYCNGHNASGQVGDGTYQDRVALTLINIPDVRSVSVGIRTVCAVNNSNEAYCWGNNLSGNLGNPNVPYGSPVPQLVTVTMDIKDIILGESTTCGVHSDNSVTCWGANTHGEAGAGNLNETQNGFSIPDLTLFSGSFAQNTICGLNSDQDILCWGGNYNGQAGQPQPEIVTVPTQVAPHITIYKSLSNLIAGQANTCMNVEGQLYCWGNNEQGQFGYRNQNFQEVYPVKIIGAENFVQTTIGFGFICHLNANSKVVCAGLNNYGQSGKDPSENAVRTLFEIPGLEGITKIQAGARSICALKNDGTVWCWGDNENGTLGDGTFTSTHIPQQVLNLANVVEISLHTRSSHACARKSDNSVWCWGSNSNGQITGKAGDNSNVPLLIERFNDVASLSVGGYHTCILSSFGKVTCIGSNAYGQLGIGNNDDNFDFKEVPLNNIVKVAAGESHVCALDSFKNVSCWGWNNEGQLGNESYEDSKYPVKVISKVDDLAVGAAHACVLTSDNKLGCWGFNGNAQFGNGNNFNRNVPTFSDIKKK
jgi:alpha-tubulin suppressor-like RCC1 family protein